MTQSSHSAPAASSPATERGRKTRAEILAAANAVFGEKGYERASISEITRRAGVAQGTFYLYFQDKLAVFVELVDDLGAQLRRRIAEAVSGIDHRLEIERVGIRTFFQFAREHRQLYRVVRQAEFVDEAAFRRYYRRIAEGYSRGLARAMDRRQIRRGDPEVLAYGLMGLTDFLGMRWVIWEQRRDVEALVGEAVRFIHHGLSLGGAPARPPRNGAAKRKGSKR